MYHVKTSQKTMFIVSFTVKPLNTLAIYIFPAERQTCRYTLPLLHMRAWGNNLLMHQRAATAAWHQHSSGDVSPEGIVEDKKYCDHRHVAGGGGLG